MSLFRLLIRLYPRHYRERYGREMEGFYVQERAAGAGGAVYWMRLVIDHVRAARSVRRREGDGMMRRIWEDLSAGTRALARAPGFTGFAVLTLALGIGATTAVFGVLDRVVLRPLPYPGSERMALVGIDARHNPGHVGPLSGVLLQELQASLGPAEAVAAASSRGVVLQDEGDPGRTEVTLVSRGFFDFFAGRAAVGRLLADSDHEPGAEPAVVIGHSFWRERYGGDPGAVGRTIRLDGRPHTVVGVLARDFVPPPEIVEAHDLWVPLDLSNAEAERGTFFLAGVARLRPGVTREDLDAHADRVVAEAYGADGASFLLGGAVASYRDEVVGAIGGTLGRVLAAVSLLLLIACVNVASLLLTRGAERSHELAVRAAIGARRGRLVAQLLAESLVLALAGGLLGAALAWGSLELFRTYAPGGLPRLAEVAIDGRGFAFSLALGVVTVVVFGLLPALRSTGGSGSAATLATHRTTRGRREGRIRGSLIALETALAVVLAVGSALLAHDLARLAREDAGFRPEGLVSMRLDLRPRYGPEELASIWARLLESTRGLPGVTAATVATQVPYTGTRMASFYRPEGQEDEEGVFVITVIAAEDYARTLGVEVLEGRAFDATDDGSDPVALVNEAFVRRYWPGQSGVGKVVRSGGRDTEDEPDYRVVGVLADVRTGAGDEVGPHIFLPLRDSEARGSVSTMELIARTDGEAGARAASLREVVRRLDPALPVSRIETVESLASQSRARPRFYTALFGGFGMVALLLAVVGVFGTTSYAMRSRVREIGIRLALGARRTRVVGAMVARTGGVVAFGVALGLGGAALASRAMADVLVYVTPRDTLTYAAAALVVLAAGVLAAWIPAGRAGRVDPAATLREEG